MKTLNYSVVENTKELKSAFVSCSKVFGQEEIDPYEWWQEEFNLTKKSLHKAPYYCLICKKIEETIGGITWNIYQQKDVYFPAIGFLWVKNDEKYRNKGIGTSIYRQMEEKVISKLSPKTIGFLFLESNIDNSEYNIKSSIGFWEKQGYKVLSGIEYYLPCLSYDINGKPLLPDLKLQVMIKKRCVENIKLKNIISTIYCDWYEPLQNDFPSISAYKEAYGHFYSYKTSICNRLRIPFYALKVGLMYSSCSTSASWTQSSPQANHQS